MSAFRIGVDVGGTFTDYVGVRQDGLVVSGKTPSTPGHEATAVLQAIELLADQFNIANRALLAQTEVINFGTTVATNAMLELKGVRAGMITTKGFRDILGLRRGYKESLFDIRLPSPDPLIPRRLRIGVPERIDRDGHVVVPLAEEEVTVAIDRLMAEGVESYAICFLQSPANPIHEQRCAEIIKQRHPNSFVSLSSDVLNRIGEFERFSTTVVNTYLSPILRRYVERLLADLKIKGFAGRLLVMQSNGGTASVEDVGHRGAEALLSGPAGGVVAATEAGRISGVSNLIGVDMGGTSYDVSLIRGGRPDVRMDAWVARYRVALPMLDIHTIGAGGGSIAWIDAGGALRVGPNSAGASPGPACYGKGGKLPTVTDANLVLGHLSSANFLGGSMTLAQDAAEEAIERCIAARLGLSVLDAAIGIYRIVNNNMSNGIRYVSVARGHDPRDFALLAFGGAAAAHAPMQARDLGIRTILVPRAAGVLSALGTLLSDLKLSSMASYFCRADVVDYDRLNSIVAQLWKRNRSAMSSTDVLRVERRYYADLRYEGQVHELTIRLPFDNSSVTPEGWASAVVAFHEEHERLYTFKMLDKPVEVITIHQELSGVRQKVQWQVEPAELSEPARNHLKAERRVCMPVHDGSFQFLTTPIYSGRGLKPGHSIKGPAIVEEDNTTIVLHPGDAAKLNRYGIYVITVKEEVQ